MALLIVWGIIIALLPVLLSSLIAFTVMMSNIVFNIAIALSQANIYGLFVPTADGVPKTLQAFFFSSTPEVQAFYISLIAIVLAILFGALVWETVKKVFSWSFLNTTDNNNTWNWREIPKWFLIALATLVFVPGVVLVLQMATELIGKFILNMTNSLQAGLQLNALVGVDALVRINSLQWQLTAMQESFRSIDLITIGGTNSFHSWLASFNTVDIDATGKWFEIKSTLRQTISNLQTWSNTNTSTVDTQTWAGIMKNTQSSYNSLVSNWKQFTSYIKIDETNAENIFWNTLLGAKTEEHIKTWDWEAIMNNNDLSSIDTFLGSALTLPASSFWGVDGNGGNTTVLAGILGTTANSTVLTLIENSGAVFTKGQSLGFDTLNFALNLSTGTNYSLMGAFLSNQLLTDNTIHTTFQEYLNMDVAAIKTDEIARIFSSQPNDSSAANLALSPWVLFINSFIWPVVTENGTANFALGGDYWGGIFFQVVALFFLWYGVKMFFKFALYAALRIIQILWSFILAIGFALYGWKDLEPYQQEMRNIFGYVVAILGLLFSLYLFTFTANLLITGQLAGLGVEVLGQNIFDNKNILVVGGKLGTTLSGAVFNEKLWIAIIAGLIVMIVIQKQFERIPDMITQKLKLEKTYQQAADGIYQDSIGTFKAIAKVGTLTMGAASIAGKWGAIGLNKAGARGMKEIAKRSLKGKGIVAERALRTMDTMTQTKNDLKSYKNKSMHKFQATGLGRNLTALGGAVMYSGIGRGISNRCLQVGEGLEDSGYKNYKNNKNQAKTLRAKETFITDPRTGDFVYNEDGYKNPNMFGLENNSEIKKDIKTLSNATPNISTTKGMNTAEISYTQQQLDQQQTAARSVLKNQSYDIRQEQMEFLKKDKSLSYKENAIDGKITIAKKSWKDCEQTLIKDIKAEGPGAATWNNESTHEQLRIIQNSSPDELNTKYGITPDSLRDYNNTHEKYYQEYEKNNHDAVKGLNSSLALSPEGKLRDEHWEKEMQAKNFLTKKADRNHAIAQSNLNTKINNKEIITAQNTEKQSSISQPNS